MFTPCFSVFVRIRCYVNKQKHAKHSVKFPIEETHSKKKSEYHFNFRSTLRDKDNSEVENFTRQGEMKKHLLRSFSWFSDICICFGFELPLFPTELPVPKDKNSESISIIVLETKKHEDGQK